MATKEEIIANRQFATERYILSTLPTLYVPLWKRDGSTFLSDDGVGHTCTVVSVPVSQQGGIFNGTTSSVITGANSLFSITESITIIVWHNPSVVSADTKTVFCLGGGGDGLNGCVLNVNQDEAAGATAGSVTFNFYDTDWRLTGADNVLVAGTPVCIGVTYNKVNAIVYKNGVAVRAKAFTTSMVQEATPTVKIGRHAAAGLFSAGTTGDVYISTHPFSRPEIQNYYLATQWRYR